MLVFYVRAGAAGPVTYNFTLTYSHHDHALDASAVDVEMFTIAARVADGDAFIFHGRAWSADKLSDDGTPGGRISHLRALERNGTQWVWEYVVLGSGSDRELVWARGIGSTDVVANRSLSPADEVNGVFGSIQNVYWDNEERELDFAWAVAHNKRTTARVRLVWDGAQDAVVLPQGGEAHFVQMSDFRPADGGFNAGAATVAVAREASATLEFPAERANILWVDPTPAAPSGHLANFSLTHNDAVVADPMTAPGFWAYSAVPGDGTWRMTAHASAGDERGTLRMIGGWFPLPPLKDDPGRPRS